METINGRSLSEVRRYDAFKLFVAAVLFGLLLLTWFTGRPLAPSSGSSPIESGAVAEAPGVEAKVPGQPIIDIVFSTDRLVLAGRVVSETLKDQLLLAAQSTFGKEGVEDRLAIAGDGFDAGSDLKGLWPLLKSLGVGRLMFDATRWHLSGYVPDEASKAAVPKAAGELLGGNIRLQSDLVLGEPPTLDAGLLSAPVGFALGSAELTPEGKALMNRLASIIILSKDRIEISGHTDDLGSAVTNQILSDRRASTVVDYLVSRGVDAARLEKRGYGATRPIGDNKTVEGRQRNRRIEFSILKAE